MVAQLYEYTKHFMCINNIVCELYLNKATF